MASWLKAIGIGLGVLVGLILLAVLFSFISAEIRLQKRYNIQVESVFVPKDEDAITRGKKLVATGRCIECHGQNLGGQKTADSLSVGQIYASNLTAGRGGVGKFYADEDWVRAIRHGIGQDGRSLVITPAQYYYYLSDEDLGAIIAYIKSLPPIDNELPDASVGPLGRIFLTLFDPRDWLPAEKIDHTGPRPPAPPADVTAEYGRYLVRTNACLVCHNRQNISAASGGDLFGWTESEFIFNTRYSKDRSMSISIRPLTDDELKAIWLYLQTLAPEGEGA